MAVCVWGMDLGSRLYLGLCVSNSSRGAVGSANRAIMLIPTAFALSAMLSPYTGGLLFSMDVTYLLLFAGSMSLVVILGYLGIVHHWQTQAANT